MTLNLPRSWRLILTNEPEVKAESLLDPTTKIELLRGWMLHARKARERHTETARTFEHRRIRFGIVGATVSAVAGVFTVGSTTADNPVLTAILAGVTVLAAIFAALQSFLNYEGRAASHQTAATQYKTLVWHIEELLTDELHPGGPTPEDVTKVRDRLDLVETGAPVVGHETWAKVDSRFSKPRYVTSLEAPAGPDESP